MCKIKLKYSLTYNEILFDLAAFCYFISVMFNSVSGTWELSNGFYYSYISNSRIGRLLSFLSLCCVLILSLRCFMLYRRRVSRGNRVIGWTLVALFFVWAVVSYFQNLDILEVLSYSNYIPVVLFPLMAYAGFDDRIWNLVRSRIVLYIYISGVLLVGGVVSFLYRYGIRPTFYTPYKTAFNLLISCMWIAFLSGDEVRIGPVTSKLMFMVLIISAFAIQSRSWLIQALLFLWVVIMRDEKKKFNIRLIVSISGITLALLLISYLFPTITGSLYERGFTDTRTQQYRVFFEQRDFYELVYGAGVKASYTYLGSKDYIFFDNQFVYVAFHYGMLPITGLLGLIFPIFKHGSAKKSTYKRNVITGTRVVMLFMIMAFCGVSVYYQIGLDFCFLLIMILLGHTLNILSLRSA